MTSTTESGPEAREEQGEARAPEAKAPETSIPPVASGQVDDALMEGLSTCLPASRQILERMSHRYPSTGIDCLGQGERLAALVDRMLLWDAALQGEAVEAPLSLPEAEVDEAVWQRLQKMWSPALARFPSKQREWDAFPSILRAFCARHQALQSTSDYAFGDNDLELEQLWQPADALLQQLERALWQWQSSQPSKEGERRGWRRWLFWIAIVGVVGYYIVSGWLHRPPATQISKGALPKGAVTGGIQGSYFQGTQFQKLEQRRPDDGIWFHWQASPITGITPNYFSIRWSGYLRAPKRGRYKLCMHHDDGVSLRIDRRALLHYWRPGKDTVHCASAELYPGWHRLVVHFFDRYGPAIAKLSWQPPGASNPTKVPRKHLCCRNL